MSSPATRHQSPVTPRSDDEVLVRVEGVSKKFCRSLKKSLWYGVCDIAGELLPGRKRQRVAGSELRVAREEAEVAGSELLVASGNTSAEGASGPATSYPPLVTSPTGEASLRDGEFWAVQDVSFELRRGECLGLIGHNGAGKTTLLKMLNGLIKPDAGTITMRGRVGALIALGAGFNPILTGRENIYINGSVLGLSKKEIDAKIDEIIDFAEIGEFLDMPVQNYSSGMTVRLGFAVASSLDPDVLLIDEVLAVGDTDFREKCILRVSKMLSKCAVIFVSHNDVIMSRICSRGLYMKKGRLILSAPIDDALRSYQHDQIAKRGNKNQIATLGEDFNHLDLQISGGRELKEGDSLEMEIHYRANRALAVEEIMVSIEDFKQQAAAQSFCFCREAFSSVEGRFKVTVRDLRLKTDEYFVTIALFANNRQQTLARVRFADKFSAIGQVGAFAAYIPSAVIEA
jgi:lipopolysaccharide transport system ATP-binding protein